MPLKSIVLLLIDIVWWAIIGRIVLSWLLIVGMRSPIISQMDHALSLITDPIMRPLRRIIPPMGTIDLVPMAAILILFLVRIVVASA